MEERLGFFFSFVRTEIDSFAEEDSKIESELQCCTY